MAHFYNPTNKGEEARAASRRQAHAGKGERGGGAAEAPPTREERLQALLTQDQEVEKLLLKIHRQDHIARTTAEKDATWQIKHPISARLVLIRGSKLQCRWDLCMLILVLLSAVVMPLDLGFGLSDQPPIAVLLGLLDVFFLTDLLLGFRTAVVAHGNLVVKQPRRIAKAYLRGWFAVDLLAAIPSALPIECSSLIIATFSGSAAIAYSEVLQGHLVWEAIKLIRLARLCKLPRVLLHNRQYQQLRSYLSTSMMQLVGAIALLLFMSHLWGCAYVALVRIEVDTAVEQQLLQISDKRDAYLAAVEIGQGESFLKALALRSLPRASALRSLGFSSLAAAVVTPNATASHWKHSSEWLPHWEFLPLGSPATSRSNPHEVDTSSRAAASRSGPRLLPRPRLYLFALWWALCAMSGTAVASPSTTLETGFTLIVVLSGLLVTAYVIGTLTTSLARISAASDLERQKRDSIDQYLQYKKMPRLLRWQVQQFYQFAGFDDSEATMAELSELPVSLRLQIDLVLHRDVFLKVPFFRSLELSLLAVMVPRIHNEYSWQNTTVVREGKRSARLMMIARGFTKVAVRGSLRALLTAADFWGEESLLSETVSRWTVTTITQCHFLVLDKEQLMHVIELYPQLRRALARYASLKERMVAAELVASVTDKAAQLQKVTHEWKRTRHLLPREASASLQLEIQNWSEILRQHGSGSRSVHPISAGEASDRALRT